MISKLLEDMGDNGVSEFKKEGVNRCLPFFKGMMLKGKYQSSC